MIGVLPGGKELDAFLAGEGWSKSNAVRRMGSANRHGVFLLESGPRRAVLKIHESFSAGRRDAFAHEVVMHSFYSSRLGASVPAIRARSAECRAILFEYVAGSTLTGREDGMQDIDAMARFIVESNRPEVLEEARRAAVPKASESGVSAHDHWRCAAARVDELLGTVARDEDTALMQQFVRAEVLPALTAEEPGDSSSSWQCLSPSDFGFHNVIRREDGSLCFLDFEHAGWDDPAKLVADFILQPEARLAEPAARRFIQSLGSAAPFNAGLKSRVSEILMAQKCKWTAIILNVFVRSIADPAIKASRLAKATEYWRAPLPNL